MTCLDDEIAIAYLRGDLEKEDAERWSDHLAGCASCAAGVEDLSGLMSGTRELLLHLDDSSVDRPAPLIDRLLAGARHLRRGARLIALDSRGAAVRRHSPFTRSEPPDSAAVVGSAEARSLFALPSRRRLRAVLPAAAAVILSVFLALWMRSEPVSAAALLAESARSEELLISDPTRVVHRVLVFEHMRPGEPALRQRIEVWRRGGTRVKARRLYDEHGALLKALWSDATGEETTYRRGGRVDVVSGAELPVRAWLGGEEMWLLEPSADQFRHLLPEPSAARVEDRGDSYAVTYDAVPPASLVSATLIVRKSDRRGLAQEVVFEVDGVPHSYRISEETFEHVPSAAVRSNVFEPEADLAAPTLPAPPVAASPSPASPSVTAPAASVPLDLDGLEILAMYRLHRIGAWANASTTISRASDGGLHISASTSSEDRRTLLLQALDPLKARAPLTADIAVSADAHGVDEDPPSAVSATEMSAVPAARDLKTYFARRMDASSSSDVAVTEAALELSRWIVEHVSRRRERVGALERLISAWPEARLRALDADSLVTWQSMVQDHTTAIAYETELLRLQLLPIWRPAGDAGITRRPFEILALSDVPETVGRLVNAVTDEDWSLRAAFLPCAPAASPPADLPQPTAEPCGRPDPEPLLASLQSTQALAAGFAVPWRLEP